MNCTAFSKIWGVAAASITLLSACVPYPVYKTLQPAATVSVVDASGQAVPAAAVTLIASAYPYGREKSRDTQTTGADGKVSFTAKKEWRTEVLVIHGSEQYFWNWCISKPGFETLTTMNSSDTPFESALVVKLAPGVSTACVPKNSKP